MRRRSKLITANSMKTCRTPSVHWKNKKKSLVLAIILWAGQQKPPIPPPHSHNTPTVSVPFLCLIHSTALHSSCGVIDAPVFLRYRPILFVCACVCVCVCMHLCICAICIFLFKYSALPEFFFIYYHPLH